MEQWRTELWTWAQACASEFNTRPGILGVMIGGSLARKQEWRHSDLELGILLEEKDSTLPYFNIRNGRGVEVIQLARRDIEMQIQLLDEGDLTPLLQWPIQLWRGRIMHDPSGVLARFKRRFDGGLFQAEVLSKRVAGLQEKIDQSLGKARGLLEAGRPAAALVQVRMAMNDAILAFHWAHHELPRSQNRTDSRLRLICRRYDEMAFYRLYRAVFNLENANQVIRTAWPHVRQQVLLITQLWGESARAFFDLAVDSHFAWRQNAGILTVYRLYVPLIGGEAYNLMTVVDDPAWRAEHAYLLVFLGLDQADQDSVSGLVKRLSKAAASLKLI